MKFVFKPKTQYEKYANKIINLLVENFPQTYFVGGTVRDLLLGRKTSDIDIATTARPEQIINILQKNHISYTDKFKTFGVVDVLFEHKKISLTTFRKEKYVNSRFPKIHYSASLKEDSKRRDFTINSLYLSPKTHRIMNPCGGLKDLKERKIRFIGQPKKRIFEDPSRILRAIRFALVLEMRFEKKSLSAIKQNFHLLGTNVSLQKIQRETDKIKSAKKKKILKLSLKDPKMLDKIFLSS